MVTLLGTNFIYYELEVFHECQCMLLVSSYCFADLQLDVKGCRDVYDSFDKYVTVEHLEGDNKYCAEQYGL